MNFATLGLAATIALMIVALLAAGTTQSPVALSEVLLPVQAPGS